MPQEIRFTVAPAAEWSLKDIESYKSGTIGAAAAGCSWIICCYRLLRQSRTILPAIASTPCWRAWGTVARAIDPDSEYRVIYDYDGQTVEILLFISMKQDLESALYRYLLLQ